jgi:hypothetical protein
MIKFLRKFFFVLMLVLAWPVFAGNIDATYSIAKGYNNDIGRINFGVTTGNVTVTNTTLTGYAWSENYGWINLAPTNGGVINAAGVLSGMAWNSNIGWINFRPTNGGVTIDADGYFHGFAWSSILGWISFNCADDSSCGTLDYKVRTDWRANVSNPTFSPNGGTIYNTTNVSISTYPTDASIYYLIDSVGDPDWTSTLYSGSFVMATGTHTLKAIAYKTGIASSSVSTATYNVTEPPTGGGGGGTGGGSDVCPNLDGKQARVPNGYLLVGDQCLVDFCPNIDGAQETVPANYSLNDVGQCIPVDRCTNIAGDQATVPADMEVDSQGKCTNIDVCTNIDGDQAKVPDGRILIGNQCLVDLCPNIDGAQQEMPVGKILNEENKCVDKPIDVCPNIAGDQATVPIGKTKNLSGNCVNIIVDVCPNLSGVQSAIPVGMTRDDEGLCVEIVNDVCPNLSGVQLIVPNTMTRDSMGNCVPIEIITPPDEPQITPGDNGDRGVTGSETNDKCPNLNGEQKKVPENYKQDSVGNCVPVLPEDKTPNIVQKVSSAVVTSVAESYQATAKAVVATAKETKKVINTPAGSITTKAITTVGVAVSGATAVTAVFLNPMSFAEVFLIPFRLWALLLSFLGLKRRNRPWGTVYDSITKQPLDPAYVELINNLGAEVSTSITDLDGRYGFFAPMGAYKILAHKTNYVFPSKRLEGKTSDELYDNLYFGEQIRTSAEGEIIAKNIPLDPVKFDWNEVAKKNMNVMRFYSKWEIWIKRITNVFFYIGIAVSAVAVWAAPYPYNMIVFGLYIIMALLRFFGIKPKYFGWVLDKETGFPLAFALVKIYSVDLERELTKKACDSTGRYYALVPPGNYYVTIDRKIADGTYTSIYQSEVFTAKKGVINSVFNVSGFAQIKPAVESNNKPLVEVPVTSAQSVPPVEIKKKEINLIKDYSSGFNSSNSVTTNTAIPVEEKLLEAPAKEELLPPKEEQKLL